MYGRDGGLGENDTILSVYLQDLNKTSTLKNTDKEKDRDGVTSTGRKPIYNGSVSHPPRPNIQRPSDEKKRW